MEAGSSRTAVFETSESFATRDLAINILADNSHLPDENDTCHHLDTYDPVAVNIPPQKGLKSYFYLFKSFRKILVLSFSCV